MELHQNVVASKWKYPNIEMHQNVKWSKLNTSKMYLGQHWNTANLKWIKIELGQNVIASKCSCIKMEIRQHWNRSKLLKGKLEMRQKIVAKSYIFRIISVYIVTLCIWLFIAKSSHENYCPIFLLTSLLVTGSTLKLIRNN